NSAWSISPISAPLSLWVRRPCPCSTPCGCRRGAIRSGQLPAEAEPTERGSVRLRSAANRTGVVVHDAGPGGPRHGKFMAHPVPSEAVHGRLKIDLDPSDLRRSIAVDASGYPESLS